jgi:hypothetical protein
MSKTTQATRIVRRDAAEPVPAIRLRFIAAL